MKILNEPIDILQNLNKINSLTKYPSIETYHKSTGKKQTLIDRLSFPDLTSSEKLDVFEKIDGENFRIIILKNEFGENDYFIGSRQEIIYAKGDRLINASHKNSIESTIPIANHLLEAETLLLQYHCLVLYGEAYGGNSPSAKQYTSTQSAKWRIFDAFDLTEKEFYKQMELDQDKIASWRDYGNQPYWNYSDLKYFAKINDIDLVPKFDSITGGDIPDHLQETYDWLQQYSNSQSGIDVNGKSEGVIIRNQDRSFISKLRFEDYEKSLKNLFN